MEAPEVPTEQLTEEINHHAAHGGAASHSRLTWTMGVALSSALLAGLAAVCSLLAGHHANEAMIEQMQSSDQWAYYQAKGIKSAILSSKIDLLEGEGKKVSAKDKEKVEQYRKDQEEITALAKEKQEASEAHLRSHVVYARGVTLFQIAIALGAISVLIQRRLFWFLSLGIGVIGVVFFIQAILK